MRLAYFLAIGLVVAIFSAYSILSLERPDTYLDAGVGGNITMWGKQWNCNVFGVHLSCIQTGQATSLNDNLTAWGQRWQCHTYDHDTQCLRIGEAK